MIQLIRYGFYLLILTHISILCAQQKNHTNFIKQHMNKIHENHRYTFFCQQPFSPQNEVAVQQCTHCPVTRTAIEWMPLVPHWQLAQHLICYQEKICINAKGQRFKGLRCCKMRDLQFQNMQNDLHNLVPELRFLKQQRAHYPFGLIDGIANQTSVCHFFINKSLKVIEPSPMVRGMIARTYLYMRDTYHVPLTPDELSLYRSWHRQYPVSSWEKERNDKIKMLQGKNNPYVSSGAYG